MQVLVSNLCLTATEEDLETLFAGFGSLMSVKLIRGWDSYESRGLAVVEFTVREAGEAALEKLNKSSFMDQALAVNEIRAPAAFSAATLLTTY